MKVSVVIRVLNEEGPRSTLLKQLKQQEYDDQIEVIVVDNDSDDGSATVAKKLGAKVMSLKRDKFTYPRASNLGSTRATGDLLVFVSAHAEILHSSWIANGAKWFGDRGVACVYGPQTSMTDSPFAEKVYYGISRRVRLYRKASPQSRAGMGVMGAGNCMMRTSYFQDHVYNESFAAGGEDQEWARVALEDGKKIIRDPDFVVRHAHRLGALNLIRQHFYWMSLSTPGRFSRQKLSS